MKTVAIRTYEAFVKHGRPYYPDIVGGRLLLCSVSKNADDYSFGHKRRLVVDHYCVYNRPGLIAVQCLWLSRYGSRRRWFYWQDGKRVTWHKLTWDNKHKVVRAFRRVAGYLLKADPFYPPCRNYMAYVTR
jgi:hypothetical protein